MLYLSWIDETIFPLQPRNAVLIEMGAEYKTQIFVHAGWACDPRKGIPYYKVGPYQL